MMPKQKKTVIRCDEHWLNTGTIFIETAKDSKPSGLSVAQLDYEIQLLDDKGRAKSKLTFDAKRLRRVLEKLAASGEIHGMVAGNDGHTTGYLIPLYLIPNVLEMVAGKEMSAGLKPNTNDVPVIITMDGSYREGGFGGGHVIIKPGAAVEHTATLEREGSENPRDDFNVAITWQAHIKDSYEGEVRGVLEALRNIEQRKEHCTLLFRCDQTGVVKMINDMRDILKDTRSIAKLPTSKSRQDIHCRLLWREIADKLQVHTFSAEHAPYSAADHDTVVCHDEANAASDRLAKRTAKRSGHSL